MNTTNNKPAALFIFGLFLLWSAISWYWYTCSIKGFCPSNSSNSTKQQPVADETLPKTVLPVIDTPVEQKPLFDTTPAHNVCTPYITHAVIARGANRKHDVMKVQLFLNKYMYMKNVLPVNGIYGARTIAGVKNFQHMYSATILAPYHLKYPTGNVTKHTLEKMNEIVCGSAAIDKLY